MLSFVSYLVERHVSIGINASHEIDREKHRDQIHDILQKSYSHPDVGGYSGLTSGSAEESRMIHNDISNLKIKAIKRDGKITAVNLYKDQHGRKLVATGHDGSEQGKKDWKTIASEDHHQKRSWGEVSGAVQHIHTKLGYPKIQAKYAAKLLDKHVTPTGEYSYRRKIGHDEHEKTIMGHPKNS